MPIQKTSFPARELAALGIKNVSYSFASAGMPEEMATKYASQAMRALSKLFCLPADAVTVKFKERLPGAAPFALTCYRGKSSVEVAVVLAAKRVLPGLRACQAKAQRLAKV